MDGGAWWAAVHGVAKSRTRLSDFTLTFHFHENFSPVYGVAQSQTLNRLSSSSSSSASEQEIGETAITLVNKEKAMASHSSTLAWKIPRTEEPGRLQSMGS